MIHSTAGEGKTLGPLKHLLIGLFIFLVIVLSCEWFLGLFNLAQHDMEFLHHSSYPIFVPGEGIHATDYVTSPHFHDVLNLQSFPRVKKNGVFRIFVIGSSAAYGWPYSENFGFSGYLKRSLNDSSPGKFEIINAAGISFGSHRELDILKDLVLLDPDLVIIFCGNNEYVERNTLTTSESHEKLKIVGALRSMLAHSNIYRAIRLGVREIAPGILQHQHQDITDIRADPFVKRSSLGRSAEVDRMVLDSYRKNILAMKKLLMDQGIKGIFCTVPTNIVGWQPVSAPPKFSTAEQSTKWLTLQKDIEKLNDTNLQGEQESLRRTAVLAEEALHIVPEHAGNLFTLGQVHLAQKNFAAAYQELVKAKDLDARPIRSLSAFNDTVRSVPDESKGIFLADIEDAVAMVIRQGLTEGIFLDYCHFTMEGNKFVAIALLPVLQKTSGVNLSTTKLDAFIHADQMSFEDNLQLKCMDMYARALSFYNNGNFDKARELYEAILKNTPQGDPGFASLMMANLGFAYKGLGNEAGYRKIFRKALDTDPNNLTALREMGNILLQDKELDKSRELFQRIIKLNPYTPEALEGMGEIARQRGEAGKALDYYRDAIKLGGDDLVVRKGMGNALMALGQGNAAIKEWRQALAFDPADHEIQELLRRHPDGNSN